MLIDLTQIPSNVCIEIHKEYAKAIPQPRAKMLDYFIKNGLNAMIESITDF